MPDWKAGFGNGSFMDILELVLLLLGIILALFIISVIIHRRRPKINDLKEHINVINGLALHGKTDELKDYTSSLTRDWESLSSKTFCDVPAVDIVIADKYNIAKANGIKTDFAANGIKEANADDIYLCSIIANLLNNAIEAAALCKNDRYVIFHCGIVMDNLVITCRNIYSENNNKKSDPQNHGYGLHIIDDFTKLMGGNFVYEHNDNTFTAIVTIPINKMEESSNDKHSDN